MYRHLTNQLTKWEDWIKAWNFTKNDCDQETGKEYSTIVQIIVKDDRGKAWRSLSCKMTCYHVSDEKQYKFSVCILSAVCILFLVCIFYPVCGLQFAFCTDRTDIAVFVRASLKSGPKYWSSEKIWLCSFALSRGHRVCWNEPTTGPPWCGHFGFSIQVAFLEVRKCNLSYILIKPYNYSFNVSFWTSSKLILTFTKWGGVACEITSVQDPQFPSTTASPRYLIHCFQNEWAKNGVLVSIKSKLLDASKNNWFKLPKN